MVQSNPRVCGICGRSEAENGHRLSRDHNHETGKIRGLLCRNCNLGLGRFRDNPELLIAAVEYLKVAEANGHQAEVYERYKGKAKAKRECHECGAGFTTNRNIKIYCSRACGMKAWAKRHPRIAVS